MVFWRSNPSVETAASDCVEASAPVSATLVPVAAPSTGVTSVGVFAKTSAPLPVSSEITPSNCSEVVAANCASVPDVSASPPPAGAAHVPSPRQNVPLDALVPLFKFATGRLPVTPVVSGNPVALVSTSAVGVPSAGVTRIGLVARTGAPVPDAVTQDTSVPSCERPDSTLGFASRAHFGVLFPMRRSPRTTESASVSPCVVLRRLCAVTLVR